MFDGQEMHMIKAAKEDKILKWLVKYNSNLIMFHHRFPTSTVNVARAAHPMSTRKYFGDTQYVMVHNGVIRNAKTLFGDHQELGIEYQSWLEDLTFNDSESLLWDFALTMEGKQEEMKVYGDMAFICLKIVKGELKNMYFGRNIRPLNMFRDKNSIELSSEGRGEATKEHTLYNWQYNTKRLVTKDMHFNQFKPWDNSCNYYEGSTDDIDDLISGAYDSYDDYYQHKHKTESNWQRMRQKFNKFLTSGEVTMSEAPVCGAPPVQNPLFARHEIVKTATVGEILETRQIGSQKFVVAKPKIDIDEVMEHKADFEPTTEEIQTESMNYLIKAKGMFEEAYYLAENDYQELMDPNETFDTIRKQLLLEKVMEFINSDPEYVTDKSKSSIWSALWQQKSLVM